MTGALAACGGTLPADEVAGAAADALETELGFRPEVRCPEDLPADVGAETRCTATVDGQTYGATVTVTSVDGDAAQFDVRVDRRSPG